MAKRIVAQYTLPTRAARDYADRVLAVLVSNGITQPVGTWADIVLHDVARNYDNPTGYMELVVDGSSRNWRLHELVSDPRRVRLYDHAPRGEQGTPERRRLAEMVNAELDAIPNL